MSRRPLTPAEKTAAADYQKAYRKANGAKISAQRKGYRLKNRAAILAAKSAHYVANREVDIARRRVHWLAHRDEVNARQRTPEARLRNAEEQREWRKNNKSHVTMYRRSRKHGMTPDQIRTLFRAQDYRCATCLTELDIDSPRVHIDHCHTSGRVRGILCQRCNLMLGQAKDSIDILRNAIRYLKRTG